MSEPVVSLSRTDVTTPTSRYSSVRFVYLKGRAAVWQENKKLGTATRVLFSDSAQFFKPESARFPMLVITPDETWEIRQQSSGCGCGAPTKKIPLTKLVDPEFSEVM